MLQSAETRICSFYRKRRNGGGDIQVGREKDERGKTAWETAVIKVLLLSRERPA